MPFFKVLSVRYAVELFTARIEAVKLTLAQAARVVFASGCVTVVAVVCLQQRPAVSFQVIPFVIIENTIFSLCVTTFTAPQYPGMHMPKRFQPHVLPFTAALRLFFSDISMRYLSYHLIPKREIA